MKEEMKNTNEKQIARLKEIQRRSRESTAYKVESAFLEFTEKMLERMEARGVSKSMLADRLGTSRPYVTKLLRGESNLTLESMVKIADALECRFTCHLADNRQEGEWLSFLIEEPIRDEALTETPSDLEEDLLSA